MDSTKDEVLLRTANIYHISAPESQQAREANVNASKSLESSMALSGNSEPNNIQA